MLIFYSENKKKSEKQCFKLLYKAGWHLNAGWLPEEVPQFCLFSDEKYKKMSEMQALENRSKYTALFCSYPKETKQHLMAAE